MVEAAVVEEWPRSSLTGESERAREEGERNGGRESGGVTYSQSCGLGWAGLAGYTQHQRLAPWY